MKSLSKAQSKRRDELIEQLNEAKELVEKRMDKLRDAEAAVCDAINAVNEVVAEINEFAGEVAAEQEDYYSERSEKWQESEAGEAYAEWKSQWESIYLQEASFSTAEDPELPDIDEFEQAASAAEV